MHVSLLEPGDADPNAPLPVDELAERLGVDGDAVRRWLEEGLPAAEDGRVDPFAAIDWLNWGRLDRCPVLARRWRTYLAWFRPFVAGGDAPRRLRVRRVHRLHLPQAVDRVRWHLPSMRTADHQRVHAECTPGVIEADAVTTPMTTVVEADVEIFPRRIDLPAGERKELAHLVREVVGGFRYAYRRHRPHEPLIAREISAGSCLDCAFALARALEQRGRPWRLCAGIIACDAIANPHFWLEAESPGGAWVPLDPSLPAIARMLGEQWEDFAVAYAGGCDARRVELAACALPDGLPGGATLGGLIGEAVVEIGGTAFNAWPCIDWVCGECEATFQR